MDTSIYVEIAKSLPSQFLITLKEILLISPIVYLCLWASLIGVPLVVS